MNIELTTIAISATSQQYLVNCVQDLCKGFCTTGAVQPEGGVSFTVEDQQTTNTQTVVTIKASLSFLYTPHGSCKAIPKQAYGYFKVAFIGAANAVPTIALTPLQTVVSPYDANCNCAHAVSFATPLTIAATYPA